MTLTETDTCTYIEDGDRTYAIPKEPLQCARCGVMSGVLVNWRSDTTCVPCHDEAERWLLDWPSRRKADRRIP